MAILEDGTVYPSFLERNKNSYYASLEDVSLRIGTVIASYPPSSSKNTNKLVTEYDVRVRYSDSLGATTSMIYPRVRVTSLFGSATDYFRWTPRVGNLDENSERTYGSEVLLMCINGNQRSAYIIGGIPHSSISTPDREEYPRMEFQFNGVNAEINAAGEFFVTRWGATRNDGEVINGTQPSKGGSSTIGIDEDGQIVLGTLGSFADDSFDWPRFVMAPKDNTINVFAKNDIFCETFKKFVIDAADGLRINPGDGLIDEFFIKGTTYRQQESLMHQIISKQLIVLQTTLGAASAAMTTGAALNAIPIVGGALASPAFIIVATQLATAITSLAAIQLAIDTFEVSDYLSTKHRFGA